MTRPAQPAPLPVDTPAARPPAATRTQGRRRRGEDDQATATATATSAAIPETAPEHTATADEAVHESADKADGIERLAALSVAAGPAEASPASSTASAASTAAPAPSAWIFPDIDWSGGGLLNGLGMAAVGVGGLALLAVGAKAKDQPDEAGTSNQTPSALTLSAVTVDENVAGATIGELGVVDGDAQDTHRFVVLDDRFEVVGRTLRLKAGVSLDHEAAATVNVMVRVTDAAGASLSRELTVEIRDKAEATLWSGTGGNDRWRSPSTLDADAVLPGAGLDQIDTGGGDDVLVLVGRTAESQFTQAGLDALVAGDTQLKGQLGADRLNAQANVLQATGSKYVMGSGTDRAVVLGVTDLRGAALAGIEEIDLHGEVTIDAATFGALGLRHLRGLGDASLSLVNEGAQVVQIDLSRVSMTGVRRLTLDGQVVLIADARDLADVTHLGGSGTLKGSAGSPVPDLSGKIVSEKVQVQAADGSVVSPATHRAASVVPGLLKVSGDLADHLVGGTGHDRLIGAGGDDSLSGGEGNDTLVGGAGVDVMDGGAGDDVFVVLGDITSGGKIDHPLDDARVGRPLSSLNGQWHDDDAGGAAETVTGGDGEDTLLVVGTADISHYRLSGIEHIEIRSDVRLLADGVVGLSTVQGDGSSILRLVGASGSEIDLGRIDLSGLGMLEIGEGLTVRIATTADLGGARILTGAGKIVSSDATFALGSTYTVSSALSVQREDGVDARGAATVLGSIVTAPTTDAASGLQVYPGSDGDDLITGSANADELRSGRGTDVLNGKDGNDRYRIDGSGRKVVLDSAGVDTLDFSGLGGSGPVVVNLSTGLAMARSVAGQELDIEIGGGSYAASRQPLDLMFLQDLSGSFSDDIRTVRGMLPGLIEQMRAFNPNTWFGAASFVDKPVGPFGSPSSGDYVYRTDSKLSADAAALQAAYASMVVRSGNDTPESQLEALYQLALRTARDDASARTGDGEIDFRPGSQRFVVLTTDAPFHLAGDHASAGPNDGDLTLDGTPPGTGEDYPTIEAVGRALRSANLIPIFAVASGEGSSYESLVSQFGFGSVVSLSANSSDLVRAIQSGLSTYQADIIENLVGTDDAGGDILTGNNGANTLSGGAGNDTLAGLGGNDRLDGGAGDADVAVFRGTRADYDIRVLDDGARIEVEGRRGTGLSDGLDTLTHGIEVLRFSDGDVTASSLTRTPLISSEALFERLGDHTTFALFAAAAYARDTDSQAALAAVPGLAWMTPGTLGLAGHGTTTVELNAELARFVGLPHGLLLAPGYAFKDGVYEAANGRACLARTTDALFLSFAGTDDRWDLLVNDLPLGGFNAAFDLFTPLLDAIGRYASNAANGIAHVYVTGHSLGGALVERYLKDHAADADPLKAKLRGVTFEAAPYEQLVSPLADQRLLQFEFARDVIADLGMNRGYVVDVVDTSGLGDTLKDLYAREDGNAWSTLTSAATEYHRMSTTLALTRLLDEQGLSFQPGGRDKLGGLISSEQLRVSMSFNADRSVSFGPDNDDLKIATLASDVLLAAKVLASLASRDAVGVATGLGQLLLDVKDAFDNIFEYRKTTLGLAGADQLYGGDTWDRLMGGDGDDDLTGGAGNDILEGGAGNDVLDEPSRLLPSLGANIRRHVEPFDAAMARLGERTFDELVNNGLNLFAEKRLGHALPETAWSRWLDDVGNLKGLMGSSGQFIKGLGTGLALDGLSALLEELVVWRNRGNDTLIGGIGHDLYFIDTSRDQVIELAGEGYDGVVVTGTATEANVFGLFADNRYLLPDHVEFGICRDDIVKSEDFTIDASAHADRVFLVGNGGNNRLVGGNGNDILVGGADEDWLIGGDGDDQLSGGVLGKLTFSPLSAELQRVLDAAAEHADAAATDNADFSYLRGGKGSDTLWGDIGDGDYFIIDIDRTHAVDQVKDFAAALTPDLLADFDKLVFSAEQLGVSADALDAIGFSGIAMDGLSADVLSSFNYMDLNRIADYAVNDGIDTAPVFLLDQETGILWFDQDGSQDIGDQYPVAHITFTLGSLTLFGADDILIMDSYAVLA